MKPLNEIFSKADGLQIAEWAHGRPVEIEGIFEEIPPDDDNNMCTGRLIIKKASGGVLDVVIYTDGDVSFQNWSGVRHRMAEPLKIYELILERFKNQGE